MPETAPSEVELLGNSVSYSVRQSEEAAEPRIDVDIRGVSVVLPEGSAEDPESLLEENAAWVLEKKREFDAYREQVPERRFEEGESFPYLNDPHEVIVENRPTSVVEDRAFRLAAHHVEQTSIKRALETLYRRKARETFEARADKYAKEVGLEYEEIEVRNQRTKWGSCSTAGTLGLNWRLMMAPLPIIDYIVIHELAHLREPNHTENFWQLVENLDPHFKEHQTWLREQSTRLIFSDDDL